MPPKPKQEGFNFMKAFGTVLLVYSGLDLGYRAKQMYDLDAFDPGEDRKWVLPAEQVYVPFSGTLEELKDEKSCWDIITAAGQRFEIKQDKVSGCGSFGSAYTACVGANCNYIGKLITFSGWMASLGLSISNTKANFTREVYMARKAGDLGIGPVVRAAYFCSKRQQGMIIMDKIEVSAEVCRSDWTNNNMERLTDKVNALHEHGILHQDLAERNVLMDVHGTPWIIDYGLALELGTPIHDVLQAYDIASLYYELFPVLQLYQARLQNNLIGKPTEMVAGNPKLPLREGMPANVQNRWGFSDETWLEATRLRYNWKASMPFFQWQRVNTISTTAWNPDAVGYVQLVLLQLSPGWKTYFQKQGPAVLLDAFAYTYGRLGFRQGKKVKQVISRYLKS